MFIENCLIVLMHNRITFAIIYIKYQYNEQFDQ